MNDFKKILIICPGGAMTAGPEALHQLAAELNQLKQTAVMVYHPFHKTFSTPIPYQKYQTPVETFSDEDDNLIVYPEIFTNLALKTKHAKAAIGGFLLKTLTVFGIRNPYENKYAN